MMKCFGLDESMVSNLTSTLSGDTSISSNTKNESSSTTTNNTTMLQPQASSTSSFASPNQGQLPPSQPPQSKRKRSLPGNPDPDAEVIALSPKSLLAKNRFVCEICNKGFQRDQNLQLHRRGHNLPWKLKQRANKDQIRKKVYVCPEPSCVHHDPSRALGDLTGIKKHFCRKHGEKKWKCDKCSKKYAVQSDWKAHSKICGTREYRCDCGTLFSRRDSFITHRAFCDALSAAEESGRYSNNTTSHSLSLPSPQLLHSLSSLNRDPPQPSHGSFPHSWLSASSSVLPPQQQPGPHPHLFASVDEPSGAPTALLPPMSATALLQKAAEVGVSLMSTNVLHHHQQQQEASTHHVTSSSPGMCSSRNHGQPSSSGVMHDMMILNSFHSASGGGGGEFQGGLGFGDQQQQQQRLMHHHEQQNNNDNNNQGNHGVVMTSGKPPMPPFKGGGRGDDGLSTRDFLGLRPFSHKDFINMAGLGPSFDLKQQQQQQQFHHDNQQQQQFHHGNQQQQQQQQEQQQQLHHGHQQHLHYDRQNQTPW